MKKNEGENTGKNLYPEMMQYKDYQHINDKYRFNESVPPYYYQKKEYCDEYNDYPYEYVESDGKRKYSRGPRMSCPAYVDLGNTDDRMDINAMRVVWKKERNRLAAKKSREKKAGHLKELENRERRLGVELQDLKEAIIDYDNVLRELIVYLESAIDCANKKQENLILLFDCLCRLKKPNGDTGIYIKDVGDIIEKDLSISNERIDAITSRIRASLNDLLCKNVSQ